MFENVFIAIATACRDHGIPHRITASSKTAESLIRNTCGHDVVMSDSLDSNPGELLLVETDHAGYERMTRKLGLQKEQFSVVIPVAPNQVSREASLETATSLAEYRPLLHTISESETSDSLWDGFAIWNWPDRQGIKIWRGIATPREDPGPYCESLRSTIRERLLDPISTAVEPTHMDDSHLPIWERQKKMVSPRG